MAKNSAKAKARGSKVDRFLTSPRAQRRLTVVSAVVLLAGIVASSLVFVFHNSAARASHFTGTPQPPNSAPHVKPDRAAYAVAREFLLTAVRRKNLHEAYSLVAAPLKAGISRKQWESGDNQVVPYPVNNAKTVIFHPISSKPGHLYIAMSLSATKKSGLDAYTFFMQLIKKDGKWLVNYFEAENPYQGLPSNGLGG